MMNTHPDDIDAVSPSLCSLTLKNSHPLYPLSGLSHYKGTSLTPLYKGTSLTPLYKGTSLSTLSLVSPSHSALSEEHRRCSAPQFLHRSPTL